MAKKVKARLPKEMGGVKLPKAARRGKLGKLLGSPVVQSVAAAAFANAGAGLAENLIGKSIKEAKDNAGKAAGATRDLAHALSEVVRHLMAAVASEHSGNSARDGSDHADAAGAAAKTSSRESAAADVEQLDLEVAPKKREPRESARPRRTPATPRQH